MLDTWSEEEQLYLVRSKLPANYFTPFLPICQVIGMNQKLVKISRGGGGRFFGGDGGRISGDGVINNGEGMV